MKISTNSWHYRLHKFRENDTYRNLRGSTSSWPEDYKTITLCNYFWSTVWTILTTLIGAIVGILILLFILYFFGGGILGFLLAIFNIFPSFLDYGAVFVSWFFMSMGITASLIISTILTLRGDMKFAPEYIIKHLPKKSVTKVNSKPSLIGEYIQAKKSKWCPIVEVSDE